MPIEINQSEEQNIKVSRKMNIAYGILSSTQTLQYSFPKNPIDRGGWWAIVHVVAKSQTQLKQLSMNTYKHIYKESPRKKGKWQSLLKEIFPLIFPWETLIFTVKKLQV